MQHSEIEHKEPLVVVDPTDPRRNVAAVLSLDKFCTFIDCCREFLKNPELRFFFPACPLPLQDSDILDRLESKKSTQLAVVFKTPDVVEDVLYPQLYKMEQAVAVLLKNYEFSVLKTGVWSGEEETVILLELFSGKLPNVKKHIGPPVWVKEHAQKFREKYIGAEDVFGAYIENGKYVFEIRRKYPAAKGLLENQLINCSLGKQVLQSVKEGFDVIVNAEICRLKDFDFRVFLSKWL
jgi:tRNA nucleotidyltransferase (CCA-adding enzyme)